MQVDLTLNEVMAGIATIFPALFLLEGTYLAFVHRRSIATVLRALKLPLLVYGVNFLLMMALYLDVGWTIPYFSSHALFHLPMTILGFLCGYLIWEFSHYVHHWSCHKVRLLWCLHAPHHAPDHMNLSVFYVNFVLQGAHGTLVRAGICMVLGVPLPMLLLIAVIDDCWGGLVHVSEEAWESGRPPGVLGRWLLGPIHHRIHHASNPEYIDKNYCNLLPIWDKLFGTYQDEVRGVGMRYGLVRPMKAGSFSDLYFGEFRLLARDILTAPSLSDAFLYFVMPPGWKPQSKRQNLSSAAGLD